MKGSVAPTGHCQEEEIGHFGKYQTYNVHMAAIDMGLGFVKLIFGLSKFIFQTRLARR